MRNRLQQTNKLQTEYSALAATYDLQWSAYLDKSLRMTLAALADLPADSVLDVGCGTGQLLDALAKQSHTSQLFGVDSVPAMLDVAKNRVGQRATLLAGEAAKLPFVAANFQLVVISNAFHYFPDVDAALGEIRRVIEPAGNLIITDWCRDYFWMKLLNRLLPWTRHAHQHTFSSSELAQCLARNGFSLVRVQKSKIDWFWGLMTVHATPI